MTTNQLLAQIDLIVNHGIDTPTIKQIKTHAKKMKAETR